MLGDGRSRYYVTSTRPRHRRRCHRLQTRTVPDRRPIAIWKQLGRTLFPGPQYKGVADTIVQLIRRSTSGVIDAPGWNAADGAGELEAKCSRVDTRCPQEYWKMEDMPEATWKPHEKHGRLTTQSDLPDSVYAFPKQRKEPLTDAQHVRNAVARFDQVIDVSDADRALAFANIEKAASYYDVNLAETSWHELGIHPQKKAVTR